MVAKLTTYKKLVEDENLWNAWQRTSGFSKRSLINLNGKVDVIAKEFIAETMGECDILWADAINECWLQLNEYKNRVMVYVDHAAKPRNKLRSFKGLLYNYKKLEEIKFIEKEYDFEEGGTVIGGIVDCNFLDRTMLQKMIFGDYISFFLCSESTDLFTEAFYRSIYSSSVNGESVEVYIDYGSMLEQLLTSDVDLIRFAGDGGEREVSVQKFQRLIRQKK